MRQAEEGSGDEVSKLGKIGWDNPESRIVPDGQRVSNIVRVTFEVE